MLSILGLTDYRTSLKFHSLVQSISHPGDQQEILKLTTNEIISFSYDRFNTLLMMRNMVRRFLGLIPFTSVLNPLIAGVDHCWGSLVPDLLHRGEEEPFYLGFHLFG